MDKNDDDDEDNRDNEGKAAVDSENGNNRIPWGMKSLPSMFHGMVLSYVSAFF